jgi:hypothetical protein
MNGTGHPRRQFIAQAARLLVPGRPLCVIERSHQPDMLLFVVNSDDSQNFKRRIGGAFCLRGHSKDERTLGLV